MGDLILKIGPFLPLLQDQRSGKTKATNVTLTNGGSGGGSYGGGGGYGGRVGQVTVAVECHLGVFFFFSWAIKQKGCLKGYIWDEILPNCVCVFFL